MRLVRPIQKQGRKPATKVEYEITVSTTLLFNTFQNVDRQVMVGGLECRDRLEALAAHLRARAAAPGRVPGLGPLQLPGGELPRALAADLRARGRLPRPGHPPRGGGRGLRHRRRRPGELRARGRAPRRRVNRITRRATVLVESPGGRLFTDGKRYQTFYVPLPMLRKVD